MSSYIKSYKLFNFQSWGDTSTEIPLETDMVNIIEGANETGKSVLYKVLYNFCFPGYWTPSELIRRGCSVGILLLQLEDDTSIIYALKPASYTYILVEPDGSKKEWTNQGCPDEIIGRMGLILDKETKIVLNIIDSDVALPFIKTSPTFNASLIRSIVEPESMTRFFQNLADTTVKVDNAHRYFGNKAATIHEQLACIPYIDSVDMENQKAIVDELVTVAELQNAVELKVSSLADCTREIITIVDDPSSVQDSIAIFDDLQQCLQLSCALQEVLRETVAEVKSPEPLTVQIDVFDRLTALYKQCCDLGIAIDGEPAIVRQINLTEELCAFDGLASILDSLVRVQDTLIETPAEVRFNDVASDIAVMDALQQVMPDISSIESTLNSLESVNQKATAIKAEVDAIIAEVGVCPTCGQLLGGNDDTCIHNS